MAAGKQRQKRGCRRTLKEDRHTAFDLASAPLMRFALGSRGDGTAVFVWAFHHILLDGRSLFNVLKEVFAIYDGVAGAASVPRGDAAPFRKYVSWLSSSTLTPAEPYWRAMLRGYTEPVRLNFGCAYGPGPAKGRRHREVACQLSRELTAAISRLARDLGVTPNTVFQASWGILLSRYSGNEDVVFGATRACRGWPGARPEDIGLFMNVLPVRMDASARGTVQHALKSLRQQHLETRAWEHTPLVDVKRWSDLPAGGDLFESLVNFERYQLNAALRDLGAGWEDRHTRLLEHASLPLGIWGFWGEKLGAKIQFDEALFTDADMHRTLGHIEVLLKAMCTNPMQRLLDMPLLTEAERQQTVVAWNDTASHYPRTKCVHELFVEQAASSPNRVAVEFGERQLTYAELCRASKDLARLLQGLGVKPGTRVGIIAERGIEMVVGLLGVLMAGGAYVPVDPGDPPVRQEAMLALAGASLLLDPRHAGGQPPPIDGRATAVTVLELSAVLNQAQETDKTPETPVAASGIGPDDLAYVMFTSGSTGEPKGVAVRHRSIVRLVRNTNFARLDSEQTFLQLAPLAFDASTLEIWGALLNGAKLALMPPGLPSLAEIGEAIRRHGVSILWLTSGLFNLMVEERIDDLCRVDQVLSGGDVLSPSHVGRLLAKQGDRALINGYGPTENTTFTCCHRVSAADLERPSIPIGRPIPNTRAYVVDRHLRPVPVGVWGELLAAGDGVASGYLNSRALTADRFIPDPFDESPGSMAYRTGDYCRWLPEGIIEFQGRIDSQVKIRGFRVELGEIQSALVRCAGVKTAVVATLGDPAGSKQLVAYWVPTSEGVEPSIAELQYHLRSQLPEYMVPAHFARLAAFPVTANGKIDRAALPEPEEFRARADVGRTPPRNLIEENLVAVWEKVLGVRPIGIHDDFFDLGGHSLLAIRLISEIEKTLASPVPVSTLLRKVSTVEAMAALISGSGAGMELPSDLCGLSAGDCRNLLANGLSITGRRVGLAKVFAEVNGGSAQGTPLFLIGSDLLDVFSEADSDLPLYCCPSVWFIPADGSSFIHSAGRFLAREIEKIWPAGPVFVSGFCVNAWVAFEVAHQLRARGRTVESLFLIDQYAPPVRVARVARLTSNYARGLSQLLADVRWRERPGLVARKLKRRLSERVSKKRDARASDTAAAPGSVSEALLAAIATYHKRVYTSPADLYLLDHGVVGNLLDRVAWRRLLKGEVHFRHRPGRHDFYSSDVMADVRRTFRAVSDRRTADTRS